MSRHSNTSRRVEGFFFSSLTYSPDISQTVDKTGTRGEKEEDIGAGDQGLMFGYATDETPELMPMTCILAHKLCIKMAELRRSGVMGYLRPDCKSQVSFVFEMLIAR